VFVTRLNEYLKRKSTNTYPQAKEVNRGTNFDRRVNLLEANRTNETDKNAVQRLQLRSEKVTKV
jgi:hypothetical protein